MKCSKCQSQLLPRTIDVAGIDGFKVQGYVCIKDECELKGLPVLMEMTSVDYCPLEQEDRTIWLSETLTEPDYLKYQTHSLPPSVSSE